MVHQLQGYFEPEPILLGGTNPVYRRRIEQEAWVLGLAAGGTAGPVAWTVFGERAWNEEWQSSQARDDPPTDRWHAEATTLGAAGQARLGEDLLLATLDVRWTGLEGFARRHDIDGTIFAADEDALSVAAELRVPPRTDGWTAAMRVSVRRESRSRRDALAEFGTEIEGWVHGFAVEVGRRRHVGLAWSVGYALALYSRSATIPDPASQGPAYQRLIAPELGVYATEALAHGGALTLRWPRSWGSFWSRAGYGRLEPRGESQRLGFAPGGHRRCWSMTLGVLLGE